MSFSNTMRRFEARSTEADTTVRQVDWVPSMEADFDMAFLSFIGRIPFLKESFLIGSRREGRVWIREIGWNQFRGSSSGRPSNERSGKAPMTDFRIS